MPKHEPEMLSAAHAAAIKRKVMTLTDEILAHCLTSGHDPVSQCVAAGLAASMMAAAHFPEERVLRVVQSVCDMMLETTRQAIASLDAQRRAGPPASKGDAQ